MLKTDRSLLDDFHGGTEPKPKEASSLPHNLCTGNFLQFMSSFSHHRDLSVLLMDAASLYVSNNIYPLCYSHLMIVVATLPKVCLDHLSLAESSSFPMLHSLGAVQLQLHCFARLLLSSRVHFSRQSI